MIPRQFDCLQVHISPWFLVDPESGFRTENVISVSKLQQNDRIFKYFIPKIRTKFTFRCNSGFRISQGTTQLLVVVLGALRLESGPCVNCASRSPAAPRFRTRILCTGVSHDLSLYIVYLSNGDVPSPRHPLQSSL